jgi:hypothetical protein
MTSGVVAVSYILLLSVKFKLSVNSYPLPVMGSWVMDLKVLQLNLLLL